ncbi:DUF975 family protein [Paenibacillus sp. CAU 1782]
MWERRELKTQAKDVLRFSYWKAFLVSFVLSLVGGGGGSGGFNFSNIFNLRNPNSEPSIFYPSEWDWELLMPFIIIGITIFIVVIGFSIAFRIFLGAPLEVGTFRFFKRSSEDIINLSDMGFSFVPGRYFTIVKAMFWRGLLTFLWTLLFIIPGIIKSYAYSMVPFILADNPNIGYRRAVELSNEMTRGHKFRMFVLSLSFIGWILLGILAFGIGVLFVLPYINATNAQLYLVLRQNAVEKGLTTRGELNLDYPIQ